MTQDYGKSNADATGYEPPATPSPTPASFDSPLQDLPQPTTLPGGESYHPAPAVMLGPGHGDRPVRPGSAPLIMAAVVGVALLLAAILVSLQLRPVKTVLPPVSSGTGTVAPTGQAETPAPTPADTEDETRSYDKSSAEPTVNKAKAAFRKHSPGIYEMVQDKDNPAVHPTSQGLSFTWSYVDPTSASAVEVHTFTVELDDRGKAIDYYSD